MKRIVGVCLTACLLAGVLVLATPGAAYADGPADGCGFFSATDPNGDGDDWVGVIDLLYVPPVGQSATVSCEFYVDGVSQGIKLGPVSGTGVIAAAGPFTYRADVDANIGICLHIVVGGVPQPDICQEVGPGLDIVEVVLDVVDFVVLSLDPTLCRALRLAAPAVNAIDPDLVWINPTRGDVYVLGGLYWDCPPYGT